MAHTFEGTRMKLFAASLAFAALAACTPQPAANGPEAVVTAIYDPLVKSKGQTATPIDAIPMTADLKELVTRAESAANDTMPVFDGDVAGNCQDCTGFSALKIGPTAEDAAAANTHKVIEANFTIQEGQRTVYWDMAETAEGWRVDNIMSEGFNLRSIANTVIAATPDVRPEGDVAVECLGYIALEIEGLKKSKPPGDTTAFEAAFAAWREKAESLFPQDKLESYFGSVVSVVGSMRGNPRKHAIESCMTKAPTQ